MHVCNPPPPPPPSIMRGHPSALLIYFDVLQEANPNANKEPGPGANQEHVRIGSVQSHAQSQTNLEQQQPRLPQQQQPEQQQTQQQQKRLADSTVLEWCSKAEELMQPASMGKQGMASEEAVPVQSPFGPLLRGLTALPAYSGNATL